MFSNIGKKRKIKTVKLYSEGACEVELCAGLAYVSTNLYINGFEFYD